ncbi:MAG TPA: hypothetical protein VFK80_00885 [Limnochordia bacterium]|nr:hypothetical protein [Limnochordia bacterium]
MELSERLTAGSLFILLLIIVHALEPPVRPARPEKPVAIPSVVLHASAEQTGAPGARCWHGECTSPSAPPRPAPAVALTNRTVRFAIDGPAPTGGTLRVLFQPIETPVQLHGKELSARLPDALHGRIRFLLALTWPQGKADYGFWVQLP